MTRKPKRIILLLDTSFGFGVTLAFNEVIDFLKKLGGSTSAVEDQNVEYALISFSSTSLASEPAIIESPFTTSYAVFLSMAPTSRQQSRA